MTFSADPATRASSATGLVNIGNSRVGFCASASEVIAEHR
jgi:hypothetical protein